MLVIHGTWVPTQVPHPACFALWGESPGARARRRARRKTPPHPYAATVEQLREAISRSAPVEAGSAPLIARLPSANGVPFLSTEPPADDGASAELTEWTLEALVLNAAQTPEMLISLAGETLPADVVLGDDLRYWIAATRFALMQLHRQQLLPTLRQEGETFVARWAPMLSNEDDLHRFAILAASMPGVGRALAWNVDTPIPQPRPLLSGYLEAVMDALARQAFSLLPPASRKERQPGADPAQAWIEALRAEPVIQGDREALSALYSEYRAWAEPSGAPATDTFRVCFRLVPPAAEPDDGTAVVAPSRDWTLEYLLQASDDPSLLVPAADVWRRSSAARFLNRKFENPQEKLLAALGRASRLFPPIESSLHTAAPESCRLSVGEAHEFVRERALLLRSVGFGVLLPGLDASLGVRLKLGQWSSTPSQVAGPGVFGWSTLVRFEWQLALGNETLSRAEFEALASLKEPLVQVRGRWVELRPGQLERALAFFEREGDHQVPLQEAVRLALAPGEEQGLPIMEVITEGWMDELVRQLRDGEREPVEEPPDFQGRLRPYQMSGVSWLATLRRYGLGACLADDMGLGKTVQLIALILHQKAAGTNGAPTLLVCPTSVVGNWRRELERFAPRLRVLVHHGAGRDRAAFETQAARHDIVISTYALLPRDEQLLAQVEWGNVVLDEAQNIKNPSSKAAQTARKLPARWRTALTGTPVENRLSELWSIFQFLSPGYLGSAEEFRRRFAGPIERAGDAVATARLKALVSPFILRRVKTDRSIIDDLPDKNEMIQYCTLTREQATLYEAVVRDSISRIEEAEGVQRRGLILATLTKLKQVCDHPALFLHDGSALPGRSGKLARLGEMLEEVVAAGDRALVFTQYAEMGTLLREHLEQLLDREVLFLHGATSAARRDGMVVRFQAEGRGPSVFILSIKAGGTGLNLTRANHVFHFDRWWNPAVENQATDRAFRIGQRKDVQVHKYVCAGTMEEAIDGLIKRKLGLAESIVGKGENWITELSSQELRELFALRQNAVEG